MRHLIAVGTSRSHRTVVMSVVRVQISAVNLARLTGHVGQQLQRTLVRRLERRQPLFQSDFVLYIRRIQRQVGSSKRESRENKNVKINEKPIERSVQERTLASVGRDVDVPDWSALRDRLPGYARQCSAPLCRLSGRN